MALTIKDLLESIRATNPHAPKNSIYITPRHHGKSSLHGMKADMVILDEVSDFDTQAWENLKSKGTFSVPMDKGQVHTDHPLKGTW